MQMGGPPSVKRETGRFPGCQVKENALRLLRLLAFFTLLGVSLIKTFHATGGIDDLLLTRHKRMALGTDLDLYVLLG